MFRRDVLKGVAAVLLATTVPATMVEAAVLPDAATNKPVQWQGHGPQALHDVLNGNVALENVYLVKVLEEDFEKVVQDIKHYGRNGQREEYGRRMQLLCSIPVEWAANADSLSRLKWVRLYGDLPLARNMARFKYFWYEPVNG